LADLEHRGEVGAGIFLAGYIGLAVPVVQIGIVTVSVDVVTAVVEFTVILVAATITATTALLVG
jgi:hypothetical protein